MRVSCGTSLLWQQVPLIVTDETQLWLEIEYKIKGVFWIKTLDFNFLFRSLLPSWQSMFWEGKFLTTIADVWTPKYSQRKKTSPLYDVWEPKSYPTESLSRIFCDCLHGLSRAASCFRRHAHQRSWRSYRDHWFLRVFCRLVLHTGPRKRYPGLWKGSGQELRTRIQGMYGA